MAEVRVTKQFKDNFDLWAEEAIDSGAWTTQEMADFKDLMRKHELADGPDSLRDTLVFYTAEGKETPAAINDPKERFRFWDEYFAGRAKDILLRRRCNEGINDRIRDQLRKAA